MNNGSKHYSLFFSKLGGFHQDLFIVPPSFLTKKVLDENNTIKRENKMEKFESTELMELVPCELQKTLTKKQTLLLGYLIMLNGLEESKTNGTFYRSNEDILEDLSGEITKPTLISSIRRLETMNLIERSSGYRTKEGKQASTYKIIENNIFKNQSNMNSEITLELVKVIRAMQEQINFQNKIIGKILLNQDLTHNLTHENPLNTEVSSDMGKIQLNENLTHNLTSDTDIDKEIDINNNINKIINNIKETSNNINNKLNKIEERENIINNIQEKETEVEEKIEEVKENELASTEFENEVEDNEEKINEYQVEEEINVEPVTVEEEIDDTNTLTDEQLEEKLTNYFNENKDSISNETEYKEFETVFNMVLQNFMNNDQITKEQFNHAKFFTVQPLLSQLRGKVYTKNDEKSSVEPQKEETLTTTQPIEENVSERQEMALNEKTETATPTEESLISVFEEMVEEERAPKKSSYKEGELDCEQALEMLKPRMYELYAQATSLAELNESYKKIVDGLQKWLEEGKINQVAFGCIKSRTWQINNDFSKKLYNIPS